MSLAHLALASTMLLAQATDSTWLEPLPYQSAPAPSEQSFDWGRMIPVVSSALVPGSGQLLQGEWIKGIIHLGFAAACMTAIQLGASQTDGTYKIVGGLGLVGIGLWSPWDAFQSSAPGEPAP